MANFATINRLYAKNFGIKPPARICVQATGSMGMAAIAVTDAQVTNVHVQSYSTWAPANIGPYS
jgi:diphthine-ammonia ligase